MTISEQRAVTIEMPLGEGVDKKIVDLDVPLVGQVNPYWCGYTNLSMILQYQGYPKFSPERIFARVHRVPPATDFGQTYMYNRPDLYTLASVTGEISNHKLAARVFTKDDYAKLKKTAPTPMRVLKSFLEVDVPCIVRVRGHFLTARGFDEKRGTLSFNDSVGPRVIEMRETDFEKRWSYDDEGRFKHPTKYLMLAVYRKRSQ